jgi:hypothetical protein
MLRAAEEGVCMGCNDQTSNLRTNCVAIIIISLTGNVCFEMHVVQEHSNRMWLGAVRGDLHGLRQPTIASCTHQPWHLSYHTPTVCEQIQLQAPQSTDHYSVLPCEDERFMLIPFSLTSPHASHMHLNSMPLASKSDKQTPRPRAGILDLA